MPRWISRSVVPAVAVIALAAAGCGSSSSSKSTVSPTPSAPATPSTPSTTSTNGKIPGSTPITSPAFRAVLHASLIQNAHVSASKSPDIEQCVIAALPGKGINTAGQFISNRTVSVEVINSCAKQNGVSK